MRSDGIFSPPSAEGEGTVLLPGSGGGLNWSGVAIDPVRQILVVNATNLAWSLRLFPAERYPEERAADPEGEVRPQKGTAFGMRRAFFLSPLLFEVPCNPPPWGTLNAIDLATGELKWKVALGSALPGPFESDIGLPSLGGAVVTATGLAFIAGTTDQYFRAFDVETGKELWRVRLPAGGQATPMTYEVRLENGQARQFVVLSAGGNGRARTELGDAVVAFALPE
jgi:quinoprotein glucose dehydrogenase